MEGLRTANHVTGKYILKNTGKAKRLGWLNCEKNCVRKGLGCVEPVGKYCQSKTLQKVAETRTVTTPCAKIVKRKNMKTK